MEGNTAPAWFVGNLGDPWVLGIAEALPRDVLWVSCPDDFPESWGGEALVPPSTIVLHRNILNATDASRLGRLLARAEKPSRVILCAAPEIRHDDLVRWSRLVDVLVSEAVASETVARHLVKSPRTPPRAAPVTVLSTDFEWREMLADVCRSLGYDAVPRRDEDRFEPEGIVLWDVPTLEPDWPRRMARRADRGKVVGLFGFVDRATVETARRAGCSACLESPCEIEDLAWVLDRLTQGRGPLRADEAHALPHVGHLDARAARHNRTEA